MTTSDNTTGRHRLPEAGAASADHADAASGQSKKDHPIGWSFSYFLD